MDDKADLLTYARDAAAAAVDLYALLGVDATTSKADIHRAWRRTGLKYHPDRAGAAYDAAKYQQFERARNVLADDEARAAYDGARSAAEHQRRQAELMGAERRRFKEELEAGERSSSAAGRGQRETERVAAEEAERETLREAGRRKMEERQRAVREAEVREEARRDERIAELERRLREKEERAKRKAERKARAGGGVHEAASAEPQAQAKTPEGPQPDAEWRKLLGAEELPFDKRPIYAHTMARLKAAGAQRRERLRARGVPTSTFVPQWDEVTDPEVKKFISRVPKFGASQGVEDVQMDVAA